MTKSNNILKRSISLFLISFCWINISLIFAGITPTRLRCENLEDPMAIDVLQPRLSWTNMADENERSQAQTAYEIRVAGTAEKLLNGEADFWKSGKVVSSQSFNVFYEGRIPGSRQDCWWQVRTWDKNGLVSDWSEPAFWSMGLIDPGEWKARWIGAPWQGEEALPKPASRRRGETAEERQMPPPAPMLRKSFTIKKEIASARAFVTGLGYFELYLNGKKVSEDVLVPNLTAYGKRPGLEDNYISVEDKFKEYRVMYLSYDIKEMLSSGENVVGAILGNGFYNAPIRWTQSYGSPRFLGQIYISYTDGTEDIIVSDQSWKASKSAITMDLVYDGEHYDARLEQPGWCTTAFDDSDWEAVAIRKSPEGKMKAHMSPTDRVMERLSPLKIDRLEEGKYRVDFGEEISGWLHLLNVNGEAGQKIDIKYICESPVGDNSYILKGDGEPESYAARFTWFVFREVEISNWPGELKAENLLAEAVYSNVETTGKFESSNELFNKINRIWWRSQTDNMHGGIVSDCPHRERSPYTGDGQVACVTVMHNFDVKAFYTKWIQDMVGAQIEETGYVPNGAPWQPGCGGGVAWGAAISIMPWEYYRHYGDLEMLKSTYEGMKGYIRYMLTWTDEEGIMFSQAPDTANPNRWMNLGDWCAPGDLPPDDMVHTFYLWRCSDLTSKTAQVLGFSEEAAKYADLAEKTRAAFQNRYYDKDQGTYGANGGNIFALKMGVPSSQYAKVLASLKADIAAGEGHLDTGIFGTQFFFEVLAENGMQELAFEAMNKTTQPSYGWWIEQGATTTWEHWNGQSSRNHPMFGGGIVWFYRALAGMNTDPRNPGYRHIIFKPQPAGDITQVSYSNETPYGKASIAWERNSEKFNLEIAVPVGSNATVFVPAADAGTVTENGKKTGEKEIVFQGMDEGYAVYTVGSGNYSFGSSL